ncbi:glycoside hydrolase family 3 C-terminal domain-containing protein [Salinimicrobium sp. TIG7-5_MAKvit]|uniref:glycoside hydrolase family 3 C-terminal domain-containing protein n=1 Tax=Salinimicrobium sp. TIG7-5_MAKvit TaxID=3121289 RepID=UPI003C6E41F5
MKKNILKVTVGMAFAFSFASCTSQHKQINNSSSDSLLDAPISNLNYEAEIDSLINKLTLEEKSGMLHGNSKFTTAGVERLGIPALTMADGPLGIREEISRDSWEPLGWENDFATFYPAGGAVAATWNPDLAYTFGKSIGEEARDRSKDVLLAPAFNIIRTPLGGRTYEYFTEDPFLNKKLVVPYVIGVQENDVAACIKHYAVNNQETNRGTVDVNVDERTLREIYLPAFKAAVIEGNAYSVMGAYNKFRGDYLNENNYLLNDILKNEWGFEGIVISDWDAVHSTVKALKNGLDVEMGTDGPFEDYYFAKPLIKAVKGGELSEAEVDESVRRVLRVMYNIKSIDSTDRKTGSRNTKEHLEDAYKIASEAIVLLKNNEDLLPLNLEKVSKVAVIGANATRKFGLGGYGAGVKTKTEITPLEALEQKLPQNIEIEYARGYEENYVGQSENNQNHGRGTINELNLDLLEEAKLVAKDSDIVIIFAGSNRDYESEASDRKDLELPFGQVELIKQIKEVNPNTIAVLIAGAPYDLREVNSSVSTLVWSWFNGSEGGNALIDVLTGDVNPSGKLPWTMPKRLEDSPAHATKSFPGDDSVTYKEGILVGYRWFDTKNIAPLYPFGYGLSYTTFNFKNAAVDKSETYSVDDSVVITLDVENSGKRAGKEVVQVYLSKPTSRIERAAKELKGFSKVMVQPGKSEKVTIRIPISEFAFYNVEKQDWEVESGEYLLHIGNSSRNILQTISLRVD